MDADALKYPGSRRIYVPGSIYPEIQEARGMQSPGFPYSLHGLCGW